MTRIVTLTEWPELEQAQQPILEAGWPPFTWYGEASLAHTERLMREFPDYQLGLLDGAGRLLGAAQSVPFCWDGTPVGLPSGWDDVLTQAMADHDGGRPATAAAALGVTVAPEARGRRLSRRLLGAMRDNAAAHHLADLVAPVRPSRKAAYPLAPIDRYLAWTTEDGNAFDPWLRVHRSLGGEVLHVCPASMVVTGTVAEWERWTGMRFPDSGDYVVPGGLVPVVVDRERDQGRYVEPNVWVRHRLGAPS